MRKGFTLVEALVALLIFEFGMLALLATMGVIARDFGVATRRARAHAAASARVEQLRASACSAALAGYAQHDGMVENWEVAASGPRRDLTDSVTFAGFRGRRSNLVLRGSVLCGS